MPRRRTEDVLLEAFPRFYYASPVVQKHVIKDEYGTHPCSEQGDAILWIIEVLSSHGQDDCEQGEVDDILCRKYDAKPPNTTIRNRIQAFKKAGLVKPDRDAKDSRKQRVKLTPEGREKLQGIKKMRLELMSPIVTMLKSAPPKERRIVLRYIDIIGGLFWEQARREAKERATRIHGQAKSRSRKGK